MKGQVVRNAIEAHGWVGLFISIPLFIIFWAGAITLFFPEVYRWAAMPQLPIAQEKNDFELNQVIDDVLKPYSVDSGKPSTLYLPSSHSPYIMMRVPLKEQVDTGGSDEEVKEKKRNFVEVIVDPNTGKIIANHDPFGMAEFFDRLHFSLKLPQGLYIVGIFTFFFLVLVFTGVVIQLKNIFTHFFLYRHKKTAKFQMRDIHNVIGVISLPYGLLYALTGVMFNLSILFQIPTLFFLYGGEQSDMLKDAGFPQISHEKTGQQVPMPDLEQLIVDFEDKYHADVSSIRLYNYYDENAVVALRAIEKESFAKRIIRHYDVKTASYPEELNDAGNNAFVEGTRILYNIHMANYAGLDLRFIYFILAIGVCFMIVAGNVLWIVKRSKPESHNKTRKVTSALTLGGCMGVVLATAVAFLLERLLPLSDMNRVDLVEQVFGLVLLLTVIVGFFAKNISRFIGGITAISGGVLLILSLYDFAVYQQLLLSLREQGFGQVFNISIVLFVTGVFLLWLGIKIYRYKPVAPSPKTRKRRTKRTIQGDSVGVDTETSNQGIAVKTALESQSP